MAGHVRLHRSRSIEYFRCCCSFFVSHCRLRGEESTTWNTMWHWFCCVGHLVQGGTGECLFVVSRCLNYSADANMLCTSMCNRQPCTIAVVHQTNSDVLFFFLSESMLASIVVFSAHVARSQTCSVEENIPIFMTNMLCNRWVRFGVMLLSV